MSNLLKFEFRKVFKSPSFYIISALLCVILIFAMIIEYEIIKSYVGTEYPMKTSGVEQMINAIDNCSFVIISGIFIIIYFCGDFSGKTIKCIYSRGFSRNEVYFAKIIVSFVMESILYFGVLFITFILGSILFGNSVVAEKNYIIILLIQYLNVLIYTSFAVMLSIIFKKVAGPIILYLVGPSAVATILSLISLIVSYVTKHYEYFEIEKYWFTTFTNYIIDPEISTSRIIIYFILSFGYGGLFCFLGYLASKKVEC